MEIETQNLGFQDQIFDHFFCNGENQNQSNPVVDFTSQLHVNLAFAQTDMEKLFISDYVDKYFNIGLNWKIPGVQDDVMAYNFLKAIHTHAMAVRKKAFPEYDSQFLEKYMDILDVAAIAPMGNGSASISKRIKKKLQQIKSVLDFPENVGLTGDLGFQSCWQKVFYLLSQIKEISTRHHFFARKWFPAIENEASFCFDQTKK